MASSINNQNITTTTVEPEYITPEIKAPPAKNTTPKTPEKEDKGINQNIKNENISAKKLEFVVSEFKA